MADIDTDISQAMTDLGIDHSVFDDGSLELEKEVESVKPDESAPSEEAKEGEVVAEKDENGNDIVKTEGEEKNTAPIEEPKLTAKEFQEIAQAKEAFEVEKKSFMDERQKLETEFQANYGDKLKDYDQMDSFLAYYAQKDPDMFKILQEDFGEYNKQSAHPMVESFNKEMAEIKKELGQFKAKASDEVTRTKLDSEINQVKSTLGKDAELAGIKIDYKAVEDFWADSKGSFEEAVLAKYGKAIIAASVSKAKVAQAAKVTQAQPKVATAGSLNRSTQSTPFSHKTSSWDDSIKQALRDVIGN